MKKLLSALIISLLILNPAIVSASEVDCAIVDTIAQGNVVSVEQGSTTNVNVLFTVTGHQEGYATFKYVSVWTASDGTLVPVETASVTTPPKAAGTVLEYYRMVSIIAGDNQPTGNYQLNITAFDIVNSNQTGAKLNIGDTATYNLAVEENNDVITTPDPVIPTPVPVDVTAPVVTFGTATPAANENGWNNTPVTIPFTVTDDLSGVRSVTPADTLVFSSEGASQTQNVIAEDNAGNSATYNSQIVNIDMTAPEITVAGVTEGTVFKLNQAAAVTWTAEDALSGIDTAVGSLISGTNLDTSSVGSKSLNITAKDKAGNITTVTINYKVIYNFSGILQPINTDGSSLFKQGSTIPVKFSLTDAGNKYISTATAKLYYSKISDNVLGSVLEAISTSSATTGNLFRYDSTSNQYIYNLNTKGLTVGTYNLTIVLDDGMTYQVRLSLK